MFAHTLMKFPLLWRRYSIIRSNNPTLNHLTDFQHARKNYDDENLRTEKQLMNKYDPLRVMGGIFIHKHAFNKHPINIQ